MRRRFRAQRSAVERYTTSSISHGPHSCWPGRKKPVRRPWKASTCSSRRPHCSSNIGRVDRRRATSCAKPRSDSWRKRTAMKQTTFEEFVELSRRGTFVPVCREIMADLLTPVSAFLKIAEHSDYAFLLESVEGGEHVGRYSFLGKDPLLVVRGRDGVTSIEQAGSRTERREPFIDVVRGLMAEFHAPFVPDLPRFTGGAVGYLDYDTAEWFEPAVKLDKPA